MISHQYTGGCHCGNIAFEVALTRRPDSYNPRACNCSFCRAHAASYISDPYGTVEFCIDDEAELSRYRQGAGIADFLICKKCDVLAGISYHNGGGTLSAAVNSRAIKNAAFGTEISASPKSLAEQDKVQWWKDAWFSGVTINAATI